MGKKLKKKAWSVVAEKKKVIFVKSKPEIRGNASYYSSQHHHQSVPHPKAWLCIIIIMTILSLPAKKSMQENLAFSRTFY